jgi:hypothetical protein
LLRGRGFDPFRAGPAGLSGNAELGRRKSDTGRYGPMRIGFLGNWRLAGIYLRTVR